MSNDDSTRDRSRHDPDPDRQNDRADAKTGAGPEPDPGSDGDDATRLRDLHRTHGNAFVQRLIAGQAIQRGGGRPHVEQQAVASPATDWAKVSASAIAATTSAVATWKVSATLVGVVVNAVTASGGTLLGPPLGPLVIAGMMGGGARPNVATAFGIGAGQAWQDWAASVKVPGLPWYPSFAAIPSPVAPPTPNIPTPLAALTGKWITAGVVRVAIRALLGPAPEPGMEAAITDYAAWFEGAFNLMLASTLVTNVLGTGPVPTWAPPYVPVGPVVGGMANSLPGFLVGGGMSAGLARPAQGGPAGKVPAP